MVLVKKEEDQVWSWLSFVFVSVRILSIATFITDTNTSTNISGLLLRLRREIRLRQIRISRQNKRLDLWQATQRVVRETEMVFDDLLGRETEPLGDGDVVVGWGLEDLCDLR